MKKKLTLVVTSVLLVAALVIGGTLAYFTDTTETVENTFTMGNVAITLTEPTWKGEGKLAPGIPVAKDPTITNTGSEDAWVFMKVNLNKFNSWLRLFAMTNDEKYTDETGNKYDLYTYGTKDGAPCTCETCKGHLNRVGLKAFFESGAYQVALDEWFGGVKHTDWKIMNFNDAWDQIVKSWDTANGGTEIKTIDLIFGYKTILKANDKATLFTSVTMPSSITNDQLADSNFKTTPTAWKLNITGYAIQADGLTTLDAAYEAMFK